jgi:sugar phosphate isomerase/epimerase
VTHVEMFLGCNFDPSHLFWNGVDPCAAIRKLGDAIFHVHAKDCKIDPFNTAITGCNDTKPYSDEINRSWISARSVMVTTIKRGKI